MPDYFRSLWDSWNFQNLRLLINNIGVISERQKEGYLIYLNIIFNSLITSNTENKY